MNNKPDATLDQLDLIVALLAERDWQTSKLPNFIARAMVLASVVHLSRSPEALEQPLVCQSDGGKVNELLGRLAANAPDDTPDWRMASLTGSGAEGFIEWLQGFDLRADQRTPAW